MPWSISILGHSDLNVLERGEAGDGLNSARDSARNERVDHVHFPVALLEITAYTFKCRESYRRPSR